MGANVAKPEKGGKGSSVDRPIVSPHENGLKTNNTTNASAETSVKTLPGTCNPSKDDTTGTPLMAVRSSAEVEEEQSDSQGSPASSSIGNSYVAARMQIRMVSLEHHEKCQESEKTEMSNRIWGVHHENQRTRLPSIAIEKPERLTSAQQRRLCSGGRGNGNETSQELNAGKARPVAEFPEMKVPATKPVRGKYQHPTDEEFDEKREVVAIETSKHHSSNRSSGTKGEKRVSSVATLAGHETNQLTDDQEESVEQPQGLPAIYTFQEEEFGTNALASSATSQADSRLSVTAANLAALDLYSSRNSIYNHSSTDLLSGIDPNASPNKSETILGDLPHRKSRAVRRHVETDENEVYAELSPVTKRVCGSARRKRASTKSVALTGDAPVDDFELASASSASRHSLSMHSGNGSMEFGSFRTMEEAFESDDEFSGRGTNILVFVSLRRPSYTMRVKRCPQCKAEIAADNARFCHVCGKELGKLQTPQIDSDISSVGTPASCTSSTVARAYHRRVKISRNSKSILGKGASGVVYKAMDVMSGQPLAVKDLTVNLDNDYEVQSIRKELRHLSTLRHANIVEYMGCLIDQREDGEAVVSILMERLECGTLSELLKQMPEGVPETAVKSFAQQLLDAVSYVHKRSVTHRDIKPSNILLSADGTIKLSDFGSAVVAAAEAEHQHDERICGTPAYMPPESLDLLKAEDVDWLTFGMAHDIWSIGCCVHELLTGEIPWAWTKLQPFALLQKVKDTEFPISDRLSDLAHDFIVKCLVHDPHNRASAVELQTHPFLDDDHSNDSERSYEDLYIEMGAESLR